MKVSTLLIIIIIGVALISAMIATVAFSRIAVIEMEKKSLLIKIENEKVLKGNKMRDEILGDIKTQIPFKNITKIKLKIDEWEQLKEMEKGK
jgi:hypothetical protein